MRLAATVLAVAGVSGAVAQAAEPPPPITFYGYDQWVMGATHLPAGDYTLGFQFKSDDGTRSIRGSYNYGAQPDADGNLELYARTAALTGGKAGTLTTWIQNDDDVIRPANAVQTPSGPALITAHLP